MNKTDREYITMKKNVYLLHGWGGRPDGGFRPWLKGELEKQGFRVHALALPNTENPTIEDWIPFMLHNIQADENTVIVTHSLSAKAVFLYLNKLPEGTNIGKVILVGGVIDTVSNMSEEDKKVLGPWIDSPVDYADAARKADSFVGFFSDNDPWIPLSNAEALKKHVNATVIIEHNMGHFNSDAGITEVTNVLKEITG